MKAAILAVGAAGVTCYTMVVALPDANQAFREITFRVVANRAEGEVKSRVFYDAFPNVMLYVREVSATGDGWSDVFLADTRNPDRPDAFVAERGRVVIDRERRLVDIVLHALEPHTGPLPSLLEHRNVRMRDREEDRFQDGAEERDPEA